MMARCSMAQAREQTFVFEMMERLGIEPGGGALPDLGLKYLRALRRCENCLSKKACREWLDDCHTSKAHAPHFCPSADLLFELQLTANVHHPGAPGYVAL